MENDKRGHNFMLCSALMLLFYAAYSILFLLIGVPLEDEGFYLLMSRLVYEGQVPYLDFHYTQTPLFPYIYGIPQLIWGNSIYVGRLTSILFTGVSLLIWLKIFKLQKDSRGALIFLFIIC